MTEVKEKESSWNGLFKIASIGSLIVAILIPLDVILFIIFPRPSTAVEFFDLIDANPFLGLVSLDLFYVIDQILMIPVMLGFYIILKRRNKSIVTLFTVIGLIGIIAIFASNPAISMLSLSDQYSAATTDSERTIYLAAANAMLAIYTGTSYHVHIILGSTALIIISIYMLKDSSFNKATAYTGILGNVFTLGLYIPLIGTLILLLSLVFFEAWVILLSRKYYQLGRNSLK